MEVKTHNTTGGVAEELRVGGILQGEDTDEAWLVLDVDVVCQDELFLFRSYPYYSQDPYPAAKRSL